MPDPEDEVIDGPAAGSAVERRLIDAVQDGRLRELLDELAGEDGLEPADRAAVDEVRAAVESIDRTLADERVRLLDRLGAGGIAATIDDRPSPRPLRSLTVDVAPAEAGSAVAVLEALGYDLAGPAAPGARRALVATRSACELTGGSDRAERITLRWPSPGLFQGRPGRILTPSDDDLRAAGGVPPPLWWLVVVWRLIRLPVRVLRRGQRPPDLGPFLGTPDELIPLLLDAAGVEDGERVADLGCGDGRILIEAARDRGCRGRGIESNPELVAAARRAVERAGLADRIEIEHGDASAARLDGIDVAIVFLPVAAVVELVPDLLERLPAGARLVVHEQQRLGASPPPDRQAILATAGGITVAHLWHR